MSNPNPTNQTPLQPGYLPGTTPQATDMLIQFADGEKVLPAWMVAHYGGNGEVEKIRGELSGITNASFVKAFFDESSAKHLSGLQSGIVAGHIGRLKQQQRFRMGR
jgi:hypothetical protein